MAFSHHTMIYTSNGDIYGAGYNSFGQLGISESANQHHFTKFKNEKDIVSIGVGHYTTYLLHENGDLYSFGHNDYGQIGDGTNVDMKEPYLVLQQVKKISNGYYTLIAEKFDGTFYGFGYNANGELGCGTFGHISTPRLLFEKKSVEFFTSGGYHTFMITEDKEIFCFGWNNSGQLGLGDKKVRGTPTLHSRDNDIVSISCGGNFTYLIKKNSIHGCGSNSFGQLGFVGEDATSPVVVMKDVKAKSASCGGGHALIIMDNADLYSCGLNDYGQLGLGNHINSSKPKFVLNRVIRTTTGDRHSLCIRLNEKNEEELYSFGYNLCGQLGTGSNQNENKPVLIKMDRAPIIFNNSSSRITEWTVDRHYFFGTFFKKSVFTFVLFLKRSATEKKFKVPKPIIYEIIKKIDFFYFFFSK
eukprot:TRINITY_DN3293_c0_g1_i1.p1 TRINITY_DN3293_c0_g1~~TRINITY_DN3293_c0_g1_i1.p1  ORF type:complete len:414 (+),score=73.73 TRINITY_DN3293_c0_g1_i1:18-1259(+)